MNRFVFDSSVTMSWCFEDEKSNEEDSILDSLQQEEREGIVPSLWRLEVVNVLSIAERHGRLSTAHSLLVLEFLLELPVIIDETTQECSK
ncbi:MAG: type II toxin-antitoxin system VapC family toxin [Alphaproteobacteria bacterium]|nr:type II toxin-antitoxin system VapC family toxin [Alphaproteobacteria bacterium]